jgi:hypothetical protein
MMNVGLGRPTTVHAPDAPSSVAFRTIAGHLASKRPRLKIGGFGFSCSQFIAKTAPLRTSRAASTTMFGVRRLNKPMLSCGPKSPQGVFGGQCAIEGQRDWRVNHGVCHY